VTPLLAQAVATLRSEALRLTGEAEHLRDRLAALEVVIERATETDSAIMWRGVALTALQVEQALPTVNQLAVHHAVHDKVIAVAYEQVGRLRDQQTGDGA
jgi:hypothetical protein